MLADAPDSLIAKIADELGIDHPFSAAQSPDSRFWIPGHFRVFISHVSAHKVAASHLQHALRRFAISSFVAHEDIEPTKEWLIEIEKALFSMDALIAILTPDFTKSQRTDHEVGIAIGRQILVIPIRKKTDPYGFIGKYQGLQGDGKTVSQVASEVFQILVSNAKTKDRLYGALVEQLLGADGKEEAEHWLTLLESQEEVPRSHLEKVQAGLSGDVVLVTDEDLKERINSLLQQQGLSLPSKSEVEVFDDDIPF